MGVLFWQDRNGNAAPQAAGKTMSAEQNVQSAGVPDISALAAVSRVQHADGQR